MLGLLIMASLVSQLQVIQSELQEDFTYQSDIDKFSMIDVWEPIPDQYQDFTGDCEEFARLACFTARKKGFPARLVFVGVESDKGDHLVCEVKGYILDNRFARVQSNTDLNYFWVSISGYNAGDPWREIIKQ